MSLLIVFSVFLILLGAQLKDFGFKRIKTFYIFASAAVIIRLLCAYFYFGHKTDVNDFLAWSDMLYRGGLPSFYASDGFTDYPPGYMYILWFIGLVKNTFSVGGSAAVLLVKLPAIAADVYTSALLAEFLTKKDCPNGMAVLLLFNPAAIINSAFWGQTDSIFTLFIVLSVIALTDNRILRAYIFFAAAVFIKPQSCMYAPLYIYFLIDGIKKGHIKEHMSAIGISLAAIFALMLPFGVRNVIAQYIDTLGSYAYASVNAFNVWAALGLNWHELTPLISAAGTVFIFAITAAAFYLLNRKERENKYFDTAVFICFSVFMLSVKMHERYAYGITLF